MENLSHTVVGLAAGELIHRSLKPEADERDNAVRRRLLLVACAIAGNFPDLDLVLSPLLPEPLGYLLHHRGHTHTLIGELAQAVVLWLLFRWCWTSARKLLDVSSAARAGLVACIAAGLLLHVGMDYLNAYGVHPFHPFDSRWLYGDLVFIVEPLFWIAFGVPVAMTAKRPVTRVMLMAFFIGAPLIFTLKGYLTWRSFAALMTLAFAAAFVQHRAGARGRQALVAAFVVGITFILMQTAALHEGRRMLASSLHRIDPTSRLVDAAMVAYPANPLCWNFTSLESNEAAGIYRLRRGILSIAPEALPVSQCPVALSERPLPADATAAIAFFTDARGSLSRLRDMQKSDCHVNAWLRFARMPWLDAHQAFDMRFGTQAEGNFTALDFAAAASQPCPSPVPGWDFPRRDLLEK